MKKHEGYVSSQAAIKPASSFPKPFVCLPLCSSLVFLGLAFCSLLRFALGLHFLLFDPLPLVHHLVVGLLVVLRFLMVAVDRASAHRTSCCVILRCVLRLVVHRGPADRHHSNVLRDVLLADKVAHVVLVRDRILVILPLLLLLLPYLAQLGARKLLNFPEHIHQASILCLDRQPAQLLLHLCRDALGPPAHLIVDQLHVLLALVLLRQLLLQLALLHLQHGILRLLALHVILRVNKLAHVLVIGLVGLLIVRARLLANLSLVLICDLKLSNLPLFHQIKGLQLVIFSLIR